VGILVVHKVGFDLGLGIDLEEEEVVRILEEGSHPFRRIVGEADIDQVVGVDLHTAEEVVHMVDHIVGVVGHHIVEVGIGRIAGEEDEENLHNAGVAAVTAPVAILILTGRIDTDFHHHDSTMGFAPDCVDSL